MKVGWLMTILWINLLVVYTFSFFARYFSTTVLATEFSPSLRPNKILVFGGILTLVMVSGLRSNIGDTYFYKRIYVYNNFTWEFITSQKDIGFGILQLFLKKLSDDPQILLFTTALITNVLIILVLYKYTRIFELSIYVFITSGFFIVSMNGIRQCLAAAIAFAATKFLFEGNWKRYMLVVLLASTIHQSALILIPIFFIIRRKAWTKMAFLLLFLAILIVIGFNQFTEVLFTALKNTQYGIYKDFKEGGANVIRVAVEGAPLLIAFLGREKLRKIMPNSDYIVNMALIGFILMIISTQNWIFARFAIYFSLYQFILVSWIVKLFKEKDQRLIYFAILILYLAYHYFDSVITMNIVYKSDYFDPIFQLRGWLNER
ncbi:capsular polysaccharide biosynthesis protein [Neobacillus bataviensis LMG 21833]|uniref:Capsular polysaccharide biosynthesis protein n=2 Tax=Neobacillus bataviensis TaxID=220685 RepID=K6DMJ9_9BACI|nr:capsular polysaccharide biosynthesis protein [Neobacillus bataviensis LMG 21833]